MSDQNFLIHLNVIFEFSQQNYSHKVNHIDIIYLINYSNKIDIYLNDTCTYSLSNN